MRLSFSLRSISRSDVPRENSRIITLMSVIVAFTFAIALWYFHYHKVTYAVKPFATIQKSLPRPCRHWLTGGGTFHSATGGTFHSDMPGTFESDMDGTFKVMQSCHGTFQATETNPATETVPMTETVPTTETVSMTETVPAKHLPRRHVFHAPVSRTGVADAPNLATPAPVTCLPCRYRRCRCGRCFAGKRQFGRVAAKKNFYHLDFSIKPSNATLSHAGGILSYTYSYSSSFNL